MGIELKIVNQEGNQEVFTLPDNVQKVDFGSMGVHSAEEVGRIKNSAVEEATNKLNTEHQTALSSKTEELSTLQTKLDSYTSKANTGENANAKLTEEISLLKGTLQKVTDNMEAKEKQTAELEYSKVLTDAASKISLINGGASLFINEARAHKHVSTTDGDVSYKLADGTLGTLDQFSKQFSDSDVGKALIMASDAGGAGTTGTGGPDLGGGGSQQKFATHKEWQAWRDKQ